MTPQSRERLAVLIERRLAGLSSGAETAELSTILETSAEARELYFRAVEFHVDLGRAGDPPALLETKESRPSTREVIRQPRAPRRTLDKALLTAAGFLVVAAFGYRMLRESPPPEQPTGMARDRGLPGAVTRTAPKSVSAPPDLPPPPPPPSPAATPPQIEMGSVPADLILEINGRFDALPPGYRTLLIEKDRTRLDELMKTRKGTSEDLEWLKSRILGEVLPAFQRDADLIRAKALELEPKLKENVASDVVTRKNGTRLEGQLVEETETFVKIRNRFGAVTIPKEEIQRIEKGKGAALDFARKYAEALTGTPAEKVERLSPLLDWCVEKSLKTQKEYVAFVILSLDASHEKARAAAGLARPALPK